MRLLWLAAFALVLTTSCALGEDYPMPSVSGAFGLKPTIAIPKGPPDTKPHVEVVSNGSGPKIKPGDTVLTDLDIRIWDGNKPYMNTYDANQPTTVVFDGQHVSKTWQDALVGKTAGSRVMLVSPAVTGFGPNGPPARVKPSDTLVLVFDVLGGYPSDARLMGQGLPSLPGDLRMDSEARTLIDGSGPQVQPGSKVVVQYVGARWPERIVFDSSYARGGPNAFALKDKSVPPGWVDALTGRRVGSRVAITVPEKETRGFTATTGGIPVPPGKPLVYVVDIIDTL